MPEYFGSAESGNGSFDEFLARLLAGLAGPRAGEQPGEELVERAVAGLRRAEVLRHETSYRT